MIIMDIYYFLNIFWIWFNLLVIIPFFISFIYRYRNQKVSQYLWTDHLSRISLFLTLVYYFFDSIVKAFVDGTQTICQKALLIHHIASFFIISPLIYNSYIPWEVDAVGFIHGYIVFFDTHVHIQKFYGFMMLYLQYRLHQEDLKNLKGYVVTRFAINFVWIFIAFFTTGDCSNFLQLEADQI